MKIKIITVGKPNETAVEQIINNYEKRLKRWTDLEWTFVRNANSVSDEGTSIIRKIKDRDFMILLDEKGFQFETSSISEKIDFSQVNNRPLAFVIGGSYGVSEEVKQRADMTWSFSQMVFPHQLMRILLVEQLYRALNYKNGGKYHHG